MCWLYALSGVLAMIAVFAYGRGRYKAGYNKARIEQKEAEENGRNNYEHGYKIGSAMPDNERAGWVRRYLGKK